ncbi:MAG TPA: hypothetical protein VGJ02_03815, partial [Pyrinomonadaceae bacterium]
MPTPISRLVSSATIITALFLVLTSQGPASIAQSALRRIEYSKVSDFVADFNERRDGERLVVTGVPSFDNMIFQKRFNMYRLEGEQPSTDVGDTFYTSPAMAKLLLTHLGTLNETFRITCTLIQFVSSQDVYRS